MKLSILFWGWYSVGLILMLFFRVPEPLRAANALFLMFFAAYALYLESGVFGQAPGHRDGESTGTDHSLLGGLPTRGRRAAVSLSTGDGTVHSRLALRAVLVGTVTYALEWVGIRTGFPFGGYRYSDTLRLFGEPVPLAIAFAWIGVMSTAVLLSGARSKWRRALQVGGWALLFDLVLDPAAYARGFWVWESEGFYAGVPWTNFAGWFATAFALSWLYPLRPEQEDPPLGAVRLYQGMLLMFGLLALQAGLMLPGLVAAAGLLLAEGGLRYDRSVQKRTV